MGRNLDIERLASEIEDAEAGPAEYKIAQYPADFTLKGLYDKWKAEQLLIPHFQRKFVWKLTQSSRLIESFLIGLPVPGVFFFTDRETQKLLIVDGQQRLQSVFSFFGGRLPGEKEKVFRLTGLRSKWEGKSYDELSNADQLRFQDTVLRATIISQLDPNDDTSIYHVFERLNTGGTQLNNQEVRNCVYWGKFNDLMLQLNKFRKWRQILGKPSEDSRQKDVELILRVLALAEAHTRYEKPMKEFMSKFMHRRRNPPKVFLNTVKGLFESTCSRIIDYLGPKPFHIHAGLNTAALDAVFVAFALEPHRNPKNLRLRYRRLKRNRIFQLHVTAATTDVDAVRKRLKIARTILFS